MDGVLVTERERHMDGVLVTEREAYGWSVSY